VILNFGFRDVICLKLERLPAAILFFVQIFVISTKWGQLGDNQLPCKQLFLVSICTKQSHLSRRLTQGNPL
jgi:hypothetical protein